MEDAPHIDRLRTAVTLENLEVVHQLVVVDPHTTYQQIENILQIGSAATETILHEYLGLRKSRCRSMPYFLTETQKRDRVDYCLEMLEKFDGGRSKRVYDIITCD